MKQRLLTTQRMLKKIRREEFMYARRVANLRTLRARLERQEEILLMSLYPEEDVIYIASKYHNLEADRLGNILEKLPDLSLDELEDIITFTNTPKV
jgi:hypothetical protein